jgi:hypothetical protein
MFDQGNRSAYDPLGYYRALNVGPLADAGDIKAAYRYKAKLLHPDRNPSEEARLEFMDVTHAYQVLSDAQQRRDYDSKALMPAPAGLIDPFDPHPKPLLCSRCGQVTAQPRYLIFHHVRSALWKTRRGVVRGIFCRGCADRTAILATTTTWILGWWSPTGPYWSLRALWRNLRGGDKPSSDNLWVLLHQARAFLSRGERDIARALAEQALDFAKDDMERGRIASLLRRAGPKGGSGRRLKNRWHPWNYASIAQSLPLVGLVAALMMGVAVLCLHDETDSVGADISVRPGQPGEIKHVATEILKVRQGPSSNQPVAALLDRFTTVKVVESAASGEWTRILTDNGVTGYVQSRYLFGGPGEAQKSRWCTDQKGQPPQNADILLRRSGGDGRLSAQNDSGRDVVVRLKTQSGRTLIAFFVGRGQTAVINGIPDGTYHAVFASGKDYSHACGVWLDAMETFAAPAAPPLVANGRQPGHEDLKVVLPPIGTAPNQSRPVPDENFLDN